MLPIQTLKILFLTTTTMLLVSKCAFATPISELEVLRRDMAEEASEELTDPQDVIGYSNKTTKKVAEDLSSLKNPPFPHRDEDLPRQEINLKSDTFLKYDVELLEARDIKKENIEVEEQFRGAGIQMNTDTFTAENIEVNMRAEVAVKPTHMLMTIIIVIMALVSIGLYAALVIWRSHLEQRYGMRELLVTNDDDDEMRQRYNDNNNANKRNGSGSNYNNNINLVSGAANATTTTNNTQGGFTLSRA